MNERIRCGGLMQRDELCLLQILGFTWTAGQPCAILSKFAATGISLSFLSIGVDDHGLKTMTLCISRGRSDQARDLLQEVEKEFAPTHLELVDGVSILTLYGPHFNEKAALASEAYSALCVAGIDSRAVGSSVNSISVVVKADQAMATRRALAKRFDWPD